MADSPEREQNQSTGQRQPIFNLPLVVTALLGLMLAIHLARTFVLKESGDAVLLQWLAFIPYRLLAPDAFPGGWLPLVWTSVTHALLHASWEHLLINAAWLAIFGTPVARRYGGAQMSAIFALSAIAGALLFAAVAVGQAFYAPSTVEGLPYLIGASGGIAGLTGAACRFVFQPVLTHRDPESGEVHVLGRRTATLGELLRDRRAGMFIVLWLVLNAAVPFVPLLFGQNLGIAWQAHLGGFIAGLLLVPAFERRQQPVTP